MIKLPSVFIYILVCAGLIVSAFFTSAFPLSEKYAIVSSFSVVLFALPCYYGLYKTLGLKNALIVILAMCIFAVLLENTAVLTGLPYGRFSYSLVMGARIGWVPWTVGLAWTPVLFGAFVISRVLIKTSNLLALIISTALLMLAFDLVLDPGAVSLGFWIWRDGGDYFSVPWSNYIGWILSSILAVIMLMIIFPKDKLLTGKLSPWIYSSFCVMLLFWSSICLFEKLFLPGIIGLGLLGYIGWLLVKIFWEEKADYNKQNI